MTLLLDTHVLVRWLIEPAKLSTVHAQAIADARTADERLAVAATTLWEIAKLVEYDRLTFDDPVEVVLDRIERNPELRVVPLDARVAVESTRLGDIVPKDPTDQIIIATARVHGLRLVTADEHIRRSGAVAVV